MDNYYVLRLQVRCVCGRKHALIENRRVRCECGALAWQDGRQPWVRLEDDYAGRQMLKRPTLVADQMVQFWPVSRPS